MQKEIRNIVNITKKEFFAKSFNHAVVTISSPDSQLSRVSDPRNRDPTVLRTSAGEDLAGTAGSAGVNKLLWLLSHSAADVELSMADCRARGVSHSFGIAFSMNGMHELT